MEDQEEKKKFEWPEKRLPLWARMLLMLLLLALVAASFYLANIPIMEHLNER